MFEIGIPGRFDSTFQQRTSLVVDSHTSNRTEHHHQT